MIEPGLPYPAHWETALSLSDGDEVFLRPVRPDDGERLGEFYEGVSQGSRRFGFFSSAPRFSPEELGIATHLDYHDRMVLAALVEDRILGIGHYAATEPGLADAGVMIQDRQHGRGIGQALMSHLALIARECGVQRFKGEVLVENHRMMQIIWDQLEHVDQDEGVDVELDHGIAYLEFNIEDLHPVPTYGEPTQGAVPP